MVRYWTLFQANLPCETSPFISRTEVTERIGAGTVGSNFTTRFLQLGVGTRTILILM